MTQASTLASPLPVSIGHMQPSEEGFVISGWKKSFRTAPQNAAIPSGSFFDRANRDVAALMARPTTQILVARDTESPDFCLGFIVFEVVDPFCIHWLYTRHGFRRLGVATKLLRTALGQAGESDLVYTHQSRFSDMAEEMGFEYVSVNSWLKGASK